MVRFLIIVAAVAIGGALAIGLANVISATSPVQIIESSNRVEISYSDFISIMLTGVSIILAVLGFVIAILAFVGWNTIGERVNGLAISFLQDAIKEDGKLYNLVKDEAKNIIYRGIDPIDEEFSEEKDEAKS
jgi:hypothetical protein